MNSKYILTEADALRRQNMTALELEQTKQNCLDDLIETIGESLDYILTIEEKRVLLAQACDICDQEMKASLPRPAN